MIHDLLFRKKPHTIINDMDLSRVYDESKLSPVKKCETMAVYEEIKPRTNREDCIQQTQNIAYATTSSIRGSLSTTRGTEMDYSFTKNSAYGDLKAIIHH